jgi:hypothetical protein
MDFLQPNSFRVQILVYRRTGLKKSSLVDLVLSSPPRIIILVLTLVIQA